MTFRNLCSARYSCRAYDNKPVETEKLAYVQECVRLAPSAVNRQPWHFITVTDPAQLQAVKDAYHRDWIQGVPAIIVCCKNEEMAWTRRYDSHNHADIDLAIAIEHLCLAATEMGLGTCWVCNFDINQLRSTFSLPTGLEPCALIPIGYPADEKPAEKVRKDISEIWENR